MDLEDQNEIYRDRFLNAFLATYSMIGVFSGIVVAIAAIIRTPTNSWMVDSASILAIIQILLIVLMFHRFRKTYDLLGFAPKDTEQNPKHNYHQRTKNYVDKSKKIRIASEFFIHAFLFVQILLLIGAWK